CTWHIVCWKKPRTSHTGGVWLSLERACKRTMELELRINGTIASLDVAANESLLTMLRREGYTSVKQGCETGECGACTVLVDDVARPSCMMLAAQAGGCTISTVESLATAGKLSPLQEAFIETGAVQ